MQQKSSEEIPYSMRGTIFEEGREEKGGEKKLLSQKCIVAEKGKEGGGGKSGCGKWKVVVECNKKDYSPNRSRVRTAFMCGNLS